MSGTAQLTIRASSGTLDPAGNPPSMARGPRSTNRHTEIATGDLRRSSDRAEQTSDLQTSAFRGWTSASSAPNLSEIEAPRVVGGLEV